ncbi:DUF192 domain-containing protein [Glaciimonas sp. PCH181]|uniref:DUF192 domain-containing protein n=1 Tax=Glaciimonas sp. PCH181 TaxID=2133943 RepID=UPI000D39A90D|nr:DUF192 domain-containing protein [Glaciimonas sp. PCH181]PUA16777.1 hypothetical protein C7W93_22595 [Glaciimonas sp. PCH181]
MQIDILVARFFWQRAVGLLGRRSLDDQQGLLIVPCNSIHTYFMRFAIDVVFIDTAGNITSIVEHVQPWRLAKAKAKAYSCLELSAGSAARLQLKVGQSLPQLAKPHSGKMIRIDLVMDAV